MCCTYAFRHGDADGPVEKDTEGEVYNSGRVIWYRNSGVIHWSDELYDFPLQHAR